MAKLLVIEDDPAHRFLLKSRLEAAGHQIIEAEDGPTGLDLVIKDNPDLVILDVIMPHVDGVNLCRAFKSNKEISRIPLIIITAAEIEPVQNACLEAGADRYMKKPWDPEYLLKSVDELLGSSPSQSEHSA